MLKGEYSISDIRRIILDKCDGYFKVGNYYRNKGRVLKFVSIKNKVLVYDEKTYEPKYMNGIFYEFEVENGLFIFTIGKPKIDEWKRV